VVEDFFVGVVTTPFKTKSKTTTIDLQWKLCGINYFF
jgi:hypothetical protein